jgi:hypothetical protein
MIEANKQAYVARLPVRRRDMPAFIAGLFAQGRYSGQHLQEETGTATATRLRHDPAYAGGSNEHRLLLKWRELDERHTMLAWRAEVIKGRFAGENAAHEANEVARILPSVVEQWMSAASARHILRDPVLGPGGRLEEPFEGILRDYSHCAGLNEVSELRRGVLPLGRYLDLPRLTSGEPTPPSLGPMLNLDLNAAYKGALVCAPPEAGKTEVILRWAVAAIEAGMSVLVIDVKGNMHRKLTARLVRRPKRLYRFSTNYREADSDRMNFLAGLDGKTAEGADAFGRLAAAILPREGFEKGEQSIYHANRLAWLTAVIGLVKLHEEYFRYASRINPDKWREHDMADVFDVLSNENKLYDIILDIARQEHARRITGDKPVEPGLQYWCDKLALLIGQAQFSERWSRLREDQPGLGLPERSPVAGGRPPNETYQNYTQNLRTALEMFDSRRRIYARISGDVEGPGRRFELEDLGQKKQVVIILEVPGRVGGEVDTLLSVAIARLEGFVSERFDEAAEKGQLQPLLLLLDETRRIRAFNPERYISFEREAQAGAVVVYQHLDQVVEEIGDERKIDNFLGVIGTQIYLGGLSGNTYKYFKNQFPNTPRQIYQVDVTPGPGGVVRNRRTTQEQVPLLEDIAVSQLPGGRFAALVYVRRAAADKPFLVDMNNRHFGSTTRLAPTTVPISV